MYCTKCGKQLDNDAVICPDCGEKTENYREDFFKDETPVGQEEKKANSEGENGMAIAGFVCAFFMPILGWIFGGIGLAKALKPNGKRKGLAIAAIIIATVVFIVNFFVNTFITAFFTELFAEIFGSMAV
ncbi:MAG: zinc-ribbon domain-containing protein [Clostridia bacterium]|nr:zinc-ribbon domain-containing protein [Clostridia bacterium]